MPGGRCASNGPDRMTRFLISVGGIKRTVFLGGVADAWFPDRTPEQLANLPAGDTFGVRWEDAVFTGRDKYLGEITASLRPEPSGGSSSFVRSLAAPTEGRESEAPEGFFPALNRNFLQFELHVPRIGAVLSSEKPIVNEAMITEIPPYGSIYKLVEPVEFSVAATENLLRPLAAVVPQVTIQACDVKLVIGDGLAPTLDVIEDDGDFVRFAAKVAKETDDPVEEYTWTLWPRPEITATEWKGVRLMNNDVDEFEFRVKRDIFYRERWMHIVATQPFETEVSGVAAFPSLA